MGVNEMGDYLKISDIGPEIILCIDLSPTYSPSISLTPTISPTELNFEVCSSRVTVEGSVCVLTTIQTVKCFGSNSNGILGYGDIVNRGGSNGEMGNYLPTVALNGNGISIHTGQASCVHLSNLEIQCWGYNGFGQLGYGDQLNRGDNPGEMGDYLPFVNYGGTVMDFTSGRYHNIAHFDNGKIKANGYNTFGQLGYENSLNKGDNINEMGNYLPFINLGIGRVSTSTFALETASCSILDNQEVKCWGLNNKGQLGYGDNVIRGNENDEMGSYLPYLQFPSGASPIHLVGGWLIAGIITSSRSLYIWGDGLNGGLVS